MGRTVYSSIAGLRGLPPVAAVVTIGTKGPRGAPTQNDRFFIKSPNPGDNNTRALHPDFGWFHQAGAEHRQVLRGNLLHSDIREAAAWHLRAFKLHNLPSPPSRRPACEGDGKTASRFARVEDGQEVFDTIACPNEACEFRQGAVKACKPLASLYLRLRWRKEGLNQAYSRWTTGSWNSAANLKGFVEHVEAVAANLGLETADVFGLPIILTLTRKTSPSKKTAFPVVQITPDCDLPEFFLEKQRLRESIHPVRALPPGQYADDFETGALDEDYADITPGIPSGPPAEDIQDAEIVQEEPEQPQEPAKTEALPPLTGEQIASIQKATGATVPQIQELAAELGNDPAAIEVEIRARS